MTDREQPADGSVGRRRGLLREVAAVAGIGLAVAVLVRVFLVAPFSIPSRSMEPTLQVGDRVLVDRVGYHVHDVRRGDVVVFNGLDSFTPESDAPPGNPALRALRSAGAAVGLAPSGERDFVKRVIGVPGDRVRCCDPQGRVTVNGEALDETDYLFPGDSPSQPFPTVVVPEGRLWVMGDHRQVSLDSRAHIGGPGGGTVPESKVIGRAFSVVWPLGHVGGLDRPATFERLDASEAAGGVPSPYALLLGLASPVLLGRRRPGDGGRNG